MISIYEPERKPGEQPQKRRGRPPTAMDAKELEKLIGGTNKRQMTLEILRTARRPRSTAECAEEFATRHDLYEDDPISSETACHRSMTPCRRPDASATLACWTAIAASRRSRPQAQAGAKGLSKCSIDPTKRICNTGYYKWRSVMPKPNLSDPITMRLPEEVLAAIQQIAETCDRSRSWVMVRALKLYLASEGADILAVRKGREQVADGDVHDMDEVLGEIHEIVNRKVA